MRFLVHAFHGGPWHWTVDGADARCSCCRYRVKGGGPEAARFPGGVDAEGNAIPLSACREGS